MKFNPYFWQIYCQHAGISHIYIAIKLFVIIYLHTYDLISVKIFII